MTKKIIKLVTKIFFRFVSENLKHIVVKLEDDVCFENDVDDHVEILKSLYVNFKVIPAFSITLNLFYYP